MRARKIIQYWPRLEPLDAKQLPSVSAAALALAGRADLRARTALHARRATPPVNAAQFQQPRSPVQGITISRITNPTPVNARLIPPFQQVQVQTNPPVPGQEYNVLYISMRNSTARTFTAADQLAVRLTVQGPSHAYPILEGDQIWRPGEVFVLTKQDYISLLRPTQSSGFSFNFTDPRVVAIPGPSGFYRRIRYNPQTFSNVLNKIVIRNPEGRGHLLGLPDTSLWQIVPPKDADIL
jgi:hypothetical protein